MEEFWSGVPIGIGVIISAVGLIISLRKNRTETAKGESDITVGVILSIIAFVWTVIWAMIAIL